MVVLLRPSPCFLLSIALALVACDDNRPRSGAATTPPAVASGATVGEPSAAPGAPSQVGATGATASASAPAASASARPLTGSKSLRERLLGAWRPLRPEAKEAEFKEELTKAEQQLKNAKTDAEKRSARERKTTVEDLGFSWTEFSKEKRTTKAPPARMVVERPYEVVKEDGRVITIRVWDSTNPRGGFEQYTFVDDKTITMPRGDGGEVDTWVRK